MQLSERLPVLVSPVFTSRPTVSSSNPLNGLPSCASDVAFVDHFAHLWIIFTYLCTHSPVLTKSFVMVTTVQVPWNSMRFPWHFPRLCALLLLMLCYTSICFWLCYLYTINVIADMFAMTLHAEKFSNECNTTPTVGWASGRASEWWAVGVVVCLQQGADCLHIVQLMSLLYQNPIMSCIIKIQNVFLLFWCRCTQIVLWKIGDVDHSKKSQLIDWLGPV